MKQTEKQTLGEKTAQNLLEMIQQKEYAPGDKLPTEAELVETLGVGRNTVREALRILMSRNIVTIRQGSGTFISEKNGVADDPLGFFMMDDRRQLTEDLIQARLILEPALAALAAQNGSEEEIKELEYILKELEGLIRDKKDYSEKDSPVPCPDRNLFPQPCYDQSDPGDHRGSTCFCGLCGRNRI